MLKISNHVVIPDHEIRMSAIRSQGPGGQNVNKVSSAIELRFDIHASSLPLYYKQRLLALADRRINRDGIVVIKAQTSRSQERNRAQALERLQWLIRRAAVTRKKRQPTRPTRASRERRLNEKTRRGQTKRQRSKPVDNE
ncbi:MAG: aminoacyl-tRNA hydrolase [Gammaproteobacteria bacterium]|nr:aminoacyl-tRNA hydrolase [Gammaproteobacteria bacterium]